jgi:hypothetical protein
LDEFIISIRQFTCFIYASVFKCDIVKIVIFLGTFFFEVSKMSVPSKIHNSQLVKIQPEERLAATSELNLAFCLVTGSGEARGMGYWAATQEKVFFAYFLCSAEGDKGVTAFSEA